MGHVYVNICVVFKAVVMTFPILGGLFQVYRRVFRVLLSDLEFQKLIVYVRSCVPLGSSKNSLNLSS